MVLNINKDLLIATSNHDKVKEFTSLLSQFHLQTKSLQDFEPIPSPEENGTTFADNANIKAIYYSNKYNIMTLADDSGLCIDELDGFPGILSARFAEEQNGFSNAINKIQFLLNLQGKTTSKAHFICALSLRFPKGHIENFTGKVTGTLTFPPRGNNGFGYDPIFVPLGYNSTFAEMAQTEKNTLSHRNLAVQALITFLSIN
ncbi:Non-canonical purine NTP pyrophosphatase [Rickettsiales bacterium Ac37b]|nr:Non-canonical purine NTP pyrophosphatase [Rickettsiales bacterium Ac37b]